MATASPDTRLDAFGSGRSSCPGGVAVHQDVQTLGITDNLDEKCYSLRDFLAVIAAARLARHPLDDVADRLLDLVTD